MHMSQSFEHLSSASTASLLQLALHTYAVQQLLLSLWLNASNHSFDDFQEHLGSGLVFYLTGVHADDAGQLEVLLGEAHALGLMGDVALAHLPALLVLDHTEHSECPVLPCSHPHARLRTLGRRRSRRRGGGGGGGGGGGAGGRGKGGRGGGKAAGGSIGRQLRRLHPCASC